MIIVAGSLIVDSQERDAYLDTCVAVVEAARRVPGCLDFALSPDLLDAARINVFERWETEDDLERFRGSGPDDAQVAALRDIRVAEYTVS
jgi:quinol monooxygenase YgiN